MESLKDKGLCHQKRLTNCVCHNGSWCGWCRGIVEFPVHFRYQPSSSMMYQIVELPSPVIYIKSMNQSHYVAQLPCSVSSNSLCSWKCMNLIRLCSAEENLNCQETIKISIPCGSGHHLVLVVFVTVLASILGTSYLLQKLFHTRVQLFMNRCPH